MKETGAGCSGIGGVFIWKDRKEKRRMRLLHGIPCDSLIFVHKCTPKFKKYGILVQNWFHRGE